MMKQTSLRLILTFLTNEDTLSKRKFTKDKKMCGESEGGRNTKVRERIREKLTDRQADRDQERPMRPKEKKVRGRKEEEGT